MKKISLALLALGFLSINFQSCTTDPCKDKSPTTLCSGKGTLVSNTNSCDCSCDAGYGGTNCSTLLLPTFINNYNNSSSYKKNSDPITTGPSGYKTKIEQATTSSVSKLKITNIFPKIVCVADDVIFYADIVDSKTIKFDEVVQCNFKASGKGTLNTDGSISFVYTVVNNLTNDKYEISTTLTK